MTRSLTVISLLLQSTTHCRYRVYTKFLLTYTAIYRGNRKVLPLGITVLQPQSHFHLGTPYTLWNAILQRVMKEWFEMVNWEKCWSQWPRGLRRRSAAARLLRSWVRIPPGAWMFVCCECCVLSCRGLCDELITRPEESYRLWCVVVCDLETSRTRRPWAALGRSATDKKGGKVWTNSVCGYYKARHIRMEGRRKTTKIPCLVCRASGRWWN